MHNLLKPNNGGNKMQWKRKPPETTGTYFFSGQFYITQGVQASLTPEEISAIYQDLQAFVKQENGVDYLQAYEHEDGRIVWIIDQLNQEMIESGDYLPEYNHCTMILPHEY